MGPRSLPPRRGARAAAFVDHAFPDDLQDLVTTARTEKISMVVARAIVSDIVRRRLEPGSPLLTEHEMAASFGVGRPSVREALRVLEAQGIVSIRPGQGGGPVVGNPTGAEFGRTASLFLQMEHVTFRDTLEALCKLFGVVAGLAAAAVARGETDRLDDLMAASKRDLTEDRPDSEFMRTGMDFHQIVHDMAGNATLNLVSSGLSYIYRTRTTEAHRGHWSAEQRERVMQDHIALARAIGRGAVAKAQELAEAHLRAELDYIDATDPGVLDEPMTWR